MSVPLSSLNETEAAVYNALHKIADQPDRLTKNTVEHAVSYLETLTKHEIRRDYMCLNCGFIGMAMRAPMSNGLSAPWCAQCQVNNLLIRFPMSDEVSVAFIRFEQLLCHLLGRQWSASGISIDKMASEIRQRLATHAGVIDTCDQGHSYAKLPDHPKKDGSPRCPHCMSIGLDHARQELVEFQALHEDCRLGGPDL